MCELEEDCPEHPNCEKHEKCKNKTTCEHKECAEHESCKNKDAVIGYHFTKIEIKTGITDVLIGLNEGQMILAYSGGLHHVHVPGEKGYRFFKTLKMNLETFSIDEYKKSFGEPVGTEAWRKKVVDDLQHRLETKVPVL